MDQDSIFQRHMVDLWIKRFFLYVQHSQVLAKKAVTEVILAYP